MTTISVSDARRTLPAQIDLVQAGERVEITRHGQIVAVLVHPSALRSPRTAALQERAEQIRVMLEEARRNTGPFIPAETTPERTAELIEDIYANRQAR